MNTYHENQLNNKLYKNWLKAALGLKYLKEGIENFVDVGVKQLHKKFLNDISSSLGLTTVVCGQCTSVNILPCPTRGICATVGKKGSNCKYHGNATATVGKCPNGICDKIRDKIVAEHRFKPSWKNTDATKWCTHPWEVAKCFMAEAGYQTASTAAETDCTGILSVAINGRFMQNVLATVNTPAKDVFSKNRNVRNTIMHSPTLEVSEADLGQYIDGMVDLLNDSKTLVTYPDAIAARQKLKQLKTETWVITTKEEITLCQEAMTALENKKQAGLQDLENCRMNILNDISMKRQELISSAETKTQLLGKDAEEHTRAICAMKDEALLDIGKHGDDVIAGVQSMIDRFQTSQEQTLATFKQAEADCQQKQTSVQEQFVTIQEELHQCQLEINRLSEAQRVMDIHSQRVKHLQGYLQRKERLKERLCGMYKRHLSTVPVSPLLSYINMDVNSLFTRPMIRNDLVHEPDPSAKDSEMNHMYWFNDKKHSMLRDIFFKNGKVCRNIYVLGDGGMGKTTLSLKLVNTWLNTLSKWPNNDYAYWEDCDDDESGEWFDVDSEDEDEEGNEDDEAILKEYDFLFYIVLRHVKSDRQILSMIQNYLFVDEPELMEITREVLEQESGKCLIVLDGLDEWTLPGLPVSIDDTGLPGKNGVRECTVITTSRPWKMELLRLNKNEIDRAVEIKGLDRKGVEKVVRIVVEKLNEKTGNNKHFTDFTYQTRQNMMRFMNVPLMLLGLIHLWYDTGLIDLTHAGVYCGLIDILIKYAENGTRKSRQNRDCKILDMSHLLEMKTKWSLCQLNLPECLSSRKTTCKVYGPLLLALGKLAFDGLFSQSTGSKLEFTEESIDEYLSYEELDIALQIGILSKSEKIGSLNHDFNISFLHKTFQEFFASLFMVSGNEEQNKERVAIYNDYCKSRKNVDEMETVLLFVAGICPPIAGELSEYYKASRPLRDINNILLKCVHDGWLVSPDTQYILIENHNLGFNSYLWDHDERQVLIDSMRYIRQAPMCGQRCLSLKVSGYNLKNIAVDQLCMCLNAAHQINHLSMHGISFECCDSNFSELKQSLENLQHLTYIDLNNVKVNGTCLASDTMLDLSNNKELNRIVYFMCSFPVVVYPGQLTDVNIKTHSECVLEKLFEAVKEAVNLKHIEVCNYVSIEKPRVCVDLTKSSYLNTLSLGGLTISSLRVNPASLRTIRLYDLIHEGELQEFFLVLKQSSHLSQLTCVYIHHSIAIDLSLNTKLTNLRLSGITSDCIKLPECVNSVELTNIEPHITAHNVLQSLQNNKHIRELSFQNETGRAEVVNFSLSDSLKSLALGRLTVNALKLPKDLQSITLSNIKPSGIAAKIVCDLKQLPHLESLKVADYKFGKYIPTIPDDIPQLKSVTICNCEMTHKGWMSFFTGIKQLKCHIDLHVTITCSPKMPTLYGDILEWIKEYHPGHGSMSVGTQKLSFSVDFKT